MYRLTLVAIALVACGNKDSKAPVAPVIDVDAGAAAPVAEASPAIADAGTPATAEAPLPSGEYEVVTEVVKDTCSPGDAGAITPATATMFVHMKVWRDKSGKDRFTGSFPLPLPRTGGYGVARSDIALDPPADPKPITLHGMGTQCPAYETTTLHKLIERKADIVKVSYSRDYGDASTCKTKTPSKCALEYVYTYRLVKKICEPRCAVSYAKSGDGGLAPKCDCPS